MGSGKYDSKDRHDSSAAGGDRPQHDALGINAELSGEGYGYGTRVVAVEGGKAKQSSSSWASEA